MCRSIVAPFLVVLLCICCLSDAADSADKSTSDIISKVTKEQSDRIPAQALRRAFDFYQQHADEIANKNFVTIVDFNRPSTERRMHVIDMRTGEVQDLLVAHGKNTGNNYATSFSNKARSNQSSLGIYLAGEEYVGKHGLSMRLDGAEPTNSNARKRAIVLHGADYVSQAFIDKHGRLGRSNGCLALEQSLTDAIVKQLQGKSVILVYRDATGGKDKNEKPDPGKEGS